MIGIFVRTAQARGGARSDLEDYFQGRGKDIIL